MLIRTKINFNPNTNRFINSNFSKPIYRPNTIYNVTSYSLNRRYFTNQFNSFEELSKWLKTDLSFNAKQMQYTDVKQILNSSCFQNKDLQNTIKNNFDKLTISEIDVNAVEEYLRHTYINTFFSPENYEKTLVNLKASTHEYELNKKLKSLNRPQTLAFVALMNKDERVLGQIDRASVIVKSAVDLHAQFINKDFSTKLNPNGKLNTASYELFFGATTIPEAAKQQDILHINQASRHIIVLVDGQAYKLNVLDELNNPLSANAIKTALESIKEQHQHDNNKYYPIGAMSSASREQRLAIRDKYYANNQPSFDDLENSLFTLCLDTTPYSANQVEDIYAHQFKNRYFSNTQFIIGPQGEAAVIANYVKIEGSPALEVMDHIYQNSLNITLDGSTELTSIPTKLNFNIDDNALADLEIDISSIHHDKKASFTLSLGTSDFKNINLSPNITMNLLLLMAMHDMTGKYPVVNYANSRRESNTPAAQLDWNYIPLEKISKFIQACQQLPTFQYNLVIKANKPIDQSEFDNNTILLFPTDHHWRYQYYDDENKKLIKGYLTETDVQNLLGDGFTTDTITHEQQYRLINKILNVEEDCSHLIKLLQDAIDENKERILSSKNGLSPTFFMHKPEGEKYDQICESYLKLGEFYPGFRNYLFRPYRNNQSIDIMTSSLRLPNSIQTIGRHGSCSEVLTMFGLHILMNKDKTELVFIPNKQWVEHLDEIVNKIQEWALKIQYLSSSNNKLSTENNNTRNNHVHSKQF